MGDLRPKRQRWWDSSEHKKYVAHRSDSPIKGLSIGRATDQATSLVQDIQVGNLVEDRAALDTAATNEGMRRTLTGARRMERRMDAGAALTRV